MKSSPNKSNEDAAKMAKSIQKPNQTKQQTKLITQGIQKGIELYKKQHKAKLREQDKIKKKANKNTSDSIEPTIIIKQPTIAWLLLAISWLGFSGYILSNTLLN
ncbi:hypothetical protein TYM08_P0576 [Marinicellulosiphila megalodicopiae]